MGKGDKKSRRGKIILGTFGVRRPRKIADKSSKTVKPDEGKKEKKLLKDTKEVPVSRESRPVRPAKEEAEPVVKEAKTEKESPKHTPKAKAVTETMVSGPEAEAAEKKEPKAARPSKEKKEAKPKKEKAD